jgi:hypothetical protein
MKKKELINEKKHSLMEKTSRYCQEYLNEDYKDLCKKLIEKMARKRECPFMRGNLDIWSAAVVYAIGSVNFLFDKNTEPYRSADDICKFFGTKKSTTGQKASLLRDMFKMHYFDTEFSTQEIKESSPFDQLEISESGLIIPKLEQNAQKGTLVQKYQEYRSLSREMNSSFVDKISTKESMQQAANLLGISTGAGPFFFEDEKEMDMLMDFLLYSLHNPAELFQDDFDTPEQKEILQAIGKSYTSLFEIQDVNPEESMMVLLDIFHEGKTVQLIDLGLSMSVSRWKVCPLIFTRIIQFSDFAMTSGCSHIFDPNIKKYLLKKYNNQMKKTRLVKRISDETIRQFVVFFQLQRSDGLEVQFQ